MTYKVVKFSTQPTTDPLIFRVAWCGEHYAKIIDVKVTGTKYVGALADAAELYVMWLVLCHWENAGQQRTARNLYFEVSRGAIKKLCRTESTKVELTELAYFARTRFYGVSIVVEKKAKWADWSLLSDLCVTLDDKPLPAPHVEVPGLGRVVITRHAIEEYAADTGHEIKPENIYSRIVERMREGMFTVEMSKSVEEHKRRRHGDSEIENTRILADAHGWHYIFLCERDVLILKTIYNRGLGY